MTEETFYHTLNRGVDKRKIFLDKQDHFRFIHNLYELNNQNRVETAFHSFRKNQTVTDIASRKERKLLVNILAFCLMPNHYHLLLSPLTENGISNFMKKINMGYAKYFNQKYKRVGTLFQGRYKSIRIVNEAHFRHLPFYIHFNPLDLSYPEWRDSKISDIKGAFEFLKSYKWSSHLDYLGIKNFFPVLDTTFLTEIFRETQGYKKSVEQYLKDIQINPDITLE